MGKSKIGWTDATLNTWFGCSVVSPGCSNCYAMSFTTRFSGKGQRFEGLAGRTPKGKPFWTGKLQLMDRAFEQVSRWEKRAAKGEKLRVFVNAFSDSFHEDVPDEWLDRLFSAMEAAPHVQFQVLTKRPTRMRDYITKRRVAQGASVRLTVGGRVIELARHLAYNHIWLGTSCEDQIRAHERIPPLLQTPATVRFISAEPLIGPINLEPFLWAHDGDGRRIGGPYGHLHWVIAGGESGPDGRRRDMDVAWARALKDQCAEAAVAFFFKQASGRYPKTHPYIDGFKYEQYPDQHPFALPSLWGSCANEQIDLADLATSGELVTV